MAMPLKNKVKIDWTSSFAYAIGIITTDGNLSPDRRHINITSRDKELVLTIKKCLNLKNKIGRKARKQEKKKKYYVLQFGDKNFYNFLLSIGLTPRKSKTIKKVSVPDEYFSDFLRGCIDGDGNIDTSHHPESKYLQLRLRLCSASLDFCKWILKEVRNKITHKGGWIYTPKNKSAYSLCFGKEDSVKIIKFMYYYGVESYLKRKHKTAKQFIGRVA